jgi:hypothetical protein
MCEAAHLAAARKIGEVWHEQMDGDPGQRWFRSVVKGVCARL